MRDALAMWKNTRMIVLVAVCAAIYGATLIVFKTAIPLIPGFTEVRVANIFPMAFGFLFGPAGAWGLAIGNLIGDIFGGTLSPGSIAGFWGNFLLGYLPYTLWTTLVPITGASYDWQRRSARSWLTYGVIAVVSSAACAVLIATVVDALGIVPYAVLSKIITINNSIGSIIGVLFLMAVSDVVRRQLGLFWPDVMETDAGQRTALHIAGAWVVTAGAVLGIVGGLLPGVSPAFLPWLSSGLICLGCLLL
jgi:energy-coupling factor transport system substrate-specific component